MTKHIPATPLPWKANANSGIVLSIAEVVPVLHPQRSPGDGVYASHAANAYPKLVEALQMVLPIIERFAAEADPQNSVLDQRQEQLRTLLHELGEAS